jgi:hypothetical protein
MNPFLILVAIAEAGDRIGILPADFNAWLRDKRALSIPPRNQEAGPPCPRKGFSDQ